MRGPTSTLLVDIAGAPQRSMRTAHLQGHTKATFCPRRLGVPVHDHDRLWVFSFSFRLPPSVSSDEPCPIHVVEVTSSPAGRFLRGLDDIQLESKAVVFSLSCRRLSASLQLLSVNPRRKNEDRLLGLKQFYSPWLAMTVTVRRIGIATTTAQRFHSTTLHEVLRALCSVALTITSATTKKSSMMVHCRSAVRIVYCSGMCPGLLERHTVLCSVLLLE